MAGDVVGASAPVRSSLTSPTGVLRRVPRDTTRTRFNHGALLLGDVLACVFSSRRLGDDLGVHLEIGGGAVVLNGRMRPAQARVLARSLMAAAEACDTAAERRVAVRQVVDAMQGREGREVDHG